MPLLQRHDNRPVQQELAKILGIPIEWDTETLGCFGVPELLPGASQPPRRVRRVGHKPPPQARTSCRCPPRCARSVPGWSDPSTQRTCW